MLSSRLKLQVSSAGNRTWPMSLPLQSPHLPLLDPKSISNYGRFAGFLLILWLPPTLSLPSFPCSKVSHQPSTFFTRKAYGCMELRIRQVRQVWPRTNRRDDKGNLAGPLSGGWSWVPQSSMTSRKMPTPALCVCVYVCVCACVWVYGSVHPHWQSNQSSPFH